MATINDIVLIHREDIPLVFARIEDILPDRKKDWYHVKMLLLQLPLQVVTWILRDIYIDGGEFTMEGRRIRMELVEAPPESVQMPIADDADMKPGEPMPVKRTTDKKNKEKKPAKKSGKIISLNGRKKKKS